MCGSCCGLSGVPFVGTVKPDGRPRPIDNQFPVYSIASKLGLGIVLSLQDKAKESIAILRAAIEPLGKKPLAVGRLQEFFANHRDFTLAIAEAVQRNTDNLKGEKLPAVLERLRSPTTMLKD